MISAIGSWADSQGKTLGKTMTPKELLVALDENFHQGLMLVAMDAVSNFILVETFADKRDAESWAGVLRASVASWPVRIVSLLVYGYIQRKNFENGVGYKESIKFAPIHYDAESLGDLDGGKPRDPLDEEFEQDEPSTKNLIKKLLPFDK